MPIYLKVPGIDGEATEPGQRSGGNRRRGGVMRETCSGRAVSGISRAGLA